VTRVHHPDRMRAFARRRARRGRRWEKARDVATSAGSSRQRSTGASPLANSKKDADAEDEHRCRVHAKRFSVWLTEIKPGCVGETIAEFSSRPDACEMTARSGGRVRGAREKGSSRPDSPRPLFAPRTPGEWTDLGGNSSLMTLRHFVAFEIKYGSKRGHFVVFAGSMR
jgi:hypothetical protein